MTHPITSFVVLILASSLVGCAIGSTKDRAPTLAGEYTDCDNVLAGSKVTLLDNGHVELELYGDDGPWEVVFSGTYSLDGNMVTASILEILTRQGPSPDVEIGFEVVWNTELVTGETILILISVDPKPIGRPWIEVGNRYSQSSDACT